MRVTSLPHMVIYDRDDYIVQDESVAMRAELFSARSNLVFASMQGRVEVNLSPKQRQKLIEMLLDHHERSSS